MSYYRYKPSRAQAMEFAKKMEQVEEFCSEHKIDHSKSYDSYYFEIDGQAYRVSNHSVEASNRGAYDKFGEQTRRLYHEGGRESGVRYIHAGKTRIIDIYNDLLAGATLDGRGRKVA